MKLRHPYFDGHPILIGDKVKFKLLDDDTNETWHWTKVQVILFQDGGTYPCIDTLSGHELFTSYGAANKHCYDRSISGWIVKHKSARR